MINLKPFFRYYHLGQKMRVSGLRSRAWQKNILYPSDQKETEVQGELKPFFTSMMCSLGVQFTLNIDTCTCCALVATNSHIFSYDLIFHIIYKIFHIFIVFIWSYENSSRIYDIAKLAANINEDSWRENRRPNRKAVWHQGVTVLSNQSWL